VDSVLPGLASSPHLHPVFVHFPIALWLTALLFWSLAFARRREDLWRFGRWLLYLGVVGAAVAVGTGLWAEEQLEHSSPGHDLVHTHRNWMLAASALGLGVAAGAFVTRRSASTRLRGWFLGALLATTILMSLGADRGALLVFRYGIGTLGEEPPGEPAHEHTHAHSHERPR
jgi:uncharacterized membrane protein